MIALDDVSIVCGKVGILKCSKYLYIFAESRSFEIFFNASQFPFLDQLVMLKLTPDIIFVGDFTTLVGMFRGEK